MILKRINRTFFWWKDSEPDVKMFQFEIPIYASMKVKLFRDPKQFNEAKGELMNEPVENRLRDGVTLKVNFTDGTTEFLVGWFDSRITTLVHEISHLSTMTLVRVGIDPRDSNGETFAYLQEALLKIVFKEFNIQNKVQE